MSAGAAPSGRPGKQGRASIDGIRAMVARAGRAAADPQLGTAIGRMKVDGVITGQQYAAPEAYGRLKGRFDREMGITRRTARSPSYGAALGGGGRLPKPTSERDLMVLKSDHTRLIATAQSAYPILDRVILDDEKPAPPREVERIRRVLDRLVIFFRIDQA